MLTNYGLEDIHVSLIIVTHEQPKVGIVYKCTFPGVREARAERVELKGYRRRHRWYQGPVPVTWKPAHTRFVTPVYAWVTSRSLPIVSTMRWSTHTSCIIRLTKVKDSMRWRASHAYEFNAVFEWVDIKLSVYFVEALSRHELKINIRNGFNVGKSYRFSCCASHAIYLCYSTYIS